MRNPEITITPAEEGGNLRSDRELGTEARKLFKSYDREALKHEKHAAVMQQIIIEAGRVLLQGKARNPGTRDFSAWCERHDLNTGRLGSVQERSYAMKIAELHDEGIDPADADPASDPAHRSTLVLDGCDQTVPSNILKWARKNQPWLFPGLGQKQAREARRRQLSAVKDDGAKHDIEDDALPFAPDLAPLLVALSDEAIANLVDRLRAERDGRDALDRLYSAIRTALRGPGNGAA